MLVSVVFGRFLAVVNGMKCMSCGDFRMMAGLLVVAGFVMRCCFPMVFCCELVMLCSLVLVLRAFVGHTWVSFSAWNVLRP